MSGRVRCIRAAAPILVGAATALASGPALAQAGERYSNYGPHMMWGWGWSGFIFGPIMMIVFLGLAVAAIVLILRWMGVVGPSAHRPPGAGGDQGRALDILRERFARGEIDHEEFEARRRTLEQ